MRPRVFIIANNPCINWNKLDRREGDIFVCMNLYHSQLTNARKKIQSCPYLIDYLWLRVCKNGHIKGTPTTGHIKQINPKTKVFFHSEYSSYSEGSYFGDENNYNQFCEHLVNKPETSSRYEIITQDMYPTKRPKLGPVVAYWAVDFEPFKDYDIYCVNFTIPYVKLQFNIWHDHELDDKLILDLEKQGRIKLIFT